MRIALFLLMFCLSFGIAYAGELFEEPRDDGLGPAPKAQLWREELRDEPIAVPKQARRSNDNLDDLNAADDVDAEIDREIGADHAADNVGSD